MKDKNEVWQLKKVDDRVITKLSDRLDISRITARILANRGYDDPKRLKDFLDCSLEKMHSPYLFTDMKRAVARIEQAVDSVEKIVVYGDYDVDGITSTSLLLKYLRDLGAEVDFYIPNRLTEGYGLNKSALKKLAAQNTDLIITVDCGIKAKEEVELANDLDLDMIITDHHTAPVELPAAEAVINPKRKDSSYPFVELAGVAVAFKLVQALALAKNGVKMPTAQKYLSLVTMGVVADIVPLRDENRIIVQAGIKQLSSLDKEEPGLFALAEVTGCLDKEISTGHIGFGLAPRINACGRLGKPELGVELLLSKTYQEAKRLAQKLDDLNDRRQELSREMQEEAESLIAQMDLNEEWVFVLAASHWHSGVIGNVASDLNEKYHRPVILIALEDGIGKGSARSISGFNIHDALLAQEDLLMAFGGHEQAAGLSIKEDMIPQLKDKLNQYAKDELKAKDLVPQRRVDAAVDLKDLSFSVVQELNKLAPFGCGNPSPKLMVEGIEISDYRLVGQGENHLKLTAQDSEVRIDGIAFNQAGAKEKLDFRPKNISLLFSPEINCWQGEKKLQLKVDSIKVPINSALEKMFVKNREGNEKKADSFFAAVIKDYKEEAPIKEQELKLGTKVKLVSKTKEDKKYVRVLTEDNQSLGFLAESYNDLARKLDVGVEYQSFIAQTLPKRENDYNLRILIKEKNGKDSKQQNHLKDFKNKLTGKSAAQSFDYLRKELYESSAGSLIEDIRKPLLNGEDLLTIIDPAQPKDKLLLSAAAWQSFSQEQMSILVYPVQSILEERFPIINEKLNRLGLQACKGISTLKDSEEVILKAKLRAKECDLLVITPQFLESNLLNWAEMKSDLGLMMIEEVDYLVDKPFLESISKIITKLSAPQLLALTSAVDEEKITKLKYELNFTREIISSYNNAELNLKRKDKRVDKYEYLLKLIQQEKPTLVYVNSPQKSESLAQKLRDEIKTKNKIAFYHQNLTVEERTLLKRKFFAGKINTLVATTAFNETLGAQNIERVIFYELCLNRYNLKYLSNQVSDSKAGVVYLLYHRAEIEDNKDILEKSLPNREILKELYILLSKHKNKAGKITISEDKLKEKLNNRIKFSINKDFLTECLQIFAELDLIERTKGKGGKIKLLDKPAQKLDLSTSIRYNECVTIKEAFSYLAELVKQRKSAVLKSITKTHSTILKGEKDIELSR